ncbi:phosphatidyl synthase [Ephemerocybe angulata]|uniref:Phosphatidyl synthase n=1 Tax=Ephemerocybe angulata TaxID=980116 RepID=A0A8H6IAV7_9AGAR|nr:phosphatidyl synthase [Tulosesus angulatus]
MQHLASLPLKLGPSRALCRRQTLKFLLTSRRASTLSSGSPGRLQSHRGAHKFTFGQGTGSRAFSASVVWKHQKEQGKEGSDDSVKPESMTSTKLALRENIYTIPNVLTVSRIVACPVLGWAILDSNYELATGLLLYAGLSDLVDGYLARRYNMGSVLGTILDPAADKILMTTLVVTLTMQSMIPVPLAVVILGRDVLLTLSAFFIRYSTLPPPKTWSRYWDVGLPSAEVRPTMVSKVNTALQLVLMGVTTASPLLPEMGLALQGLQWTVATTTIWSGMQYLTSKDAVRKIVTKDRTNP